MMGKIYRNIFLLVMAMVLMLSGCGKGAGNTADSGGAAPIDNQLTIKAIDVGQGDAFLIQTGAQVILIDTGDDKYRDGARKGENNFKLIEALDREGITHIDKLIMTHAHSDHIGYAAKVIKQYNVDELIYNGIPSAGSQFRNALKAAKAAGTKQTVVKADDVLDFGKGVLFKVLSPSAELVEQDKQAISAGEKPDANNESIVGILTFGDFSMLFTGDAEKKIEKDLLKKYGNSLACKVYKVPHHGSSTSSTAKYVRTVNPEWAIISCGEKNPYGHPHGETMKLLGERKINVMRTDEHGTITIVSDGTNYSVTGER